jgi:hypothetical protein
LKELLSFLLGFYFWIFFMGSMAHKEERFLFVVFPLFALHAAISAAIITLYFEKWKLPLSLPLGIVVFLLSAFRILAIVNNYHAPVSIFEHLTRSEPHSANGKTKFFSFLFHSSDLFVPSSSQPLFALERSGIASPPISSCQSSTICSSSSLVSMVSSRNTFRTRGTLPSTLTT